MLAVNNNYIPGSVPRAEVAAERLEMPSSHGLVPVVLFTDGASVRAKCVIRL